MSYHKKYLKYKRKYIELKRSLFLVGGDDNVELLKCRNLKGNIKKIELDAYDYIVPDENDPEYKNNCKKPLGTEVTIGGTKYKIAKILGKNTACVYELHDKDDKDTNLLLKLRNQQFTDTSFSDIYNLINNMHSELKDNGIHIMTVCAYGTTTVKNPTTIIVDGKEVKVEPYYMLFIKNGIPLEDLTIASDFPNKNPTDEMVNSRKIVLNSKLQDVLKDFIIFMEKFNKSYVHIDLKPANVTTIIDRDNNGQEYIKNIMLIDLDTSKKLAPTEKSKMKDAVKACDGCGFIASTPSIFPPEIFHFNKGVSNINIIKNNVDYSKLDYIGLIDIIILVLSRLTYNLSSLVSEVFAMYDKSKIITSKEDTPQATVVTAGTSTVVKADTGTAVKADTGTVVKADTGTVVKADTGTVVTPQATSLKQTNETVIKDPKKTPKQREDIVRYDEEVFNEVIELFTLLFIFDIDYIIKHLEYYQNFVIGTSLQNLLGSIPGIYNNPRDERQGLFNIDIIKTKESELFNIKEIIVKITTDILDKKLVLLENNPKKNDIINLIIDNLRLTPANRKPSIYTLATLL
jgi:hypothetical protein